MFYLSEMQPASLHVVVYESLTFDDSVLNKIDLIATAEQIPEEATPSAQKSGCRAVG